MGRPGGVIEDDWCVLCDDAMYKSLLPWGQHYNDFVSCNRHAYPLLPLLDTLPHPSLPPP